MEYVALAATLIGAGTSAAVSYNNNKKSAELASITSEYDAALQERQSRIARRNADLQTSVNQAALQSDQRQQNNDAQALENYAEAQRSAGRQQLARARVDAARLQARQRARLANSGFVVEGTPLDIMAETAGDIQLSLNDQLYASDIDATATLNRAGQTRRGAAQTGFSASLLQLDDLAATTRSRAELRNAELTRVYGQSKAIGYNNAATASLITGITDTAEAGATGYKNLPKSV